MIDSREISDRRFGCLFGVRQLETFLRMNDLDLLVTVHQAVNDRYEFPYLPR
jgi:hypothetical protein